MFHIVVIGVSSAHSNAEEKAFYLLAYSSAPLRRKRTQCATRQNRLKFSVSRMSIYYGMESGVL